MSGAKAIGAELETLRSTWEAHWETALGAWSRFTKLSLPRWCITFEDEKREKLIGSFAMIRLTDHAVVISLRKIREEGLERFGPEILAHEIGHHVYVPGDLRDNARLIGRIRHALPTREGYAGLVANLYADLLINHRLQRSAGLDLAGVFRTLKKEPPTDVVANVLRQLTKKNEKPDRVWTLYMRIYELLFETSAGALVDFVEDAQLQTDAYLGARVIRAYGKDWLRGAGRFGALLLPYLLEQQGEPSQRVRWLDTADAGDSAEIPDGLTVVDEDETTEAIHPAEDSALTGLGDHEPDPRQEVTGRELVGGQKNNYRSPSDYVDLMKSVGVRVTTKELVARYYRERALPHLVRSPERIVRETGDPLPEGLDVWDVGAPLANIDWPSSLVVSPLVIPGVTTLERTYGTTEGAEPKRSPVDLYIGIDCSGSMANPERTVSYPVLAGTVIALSALRTAAKVMACLSGEPGSHTQTNGFVRSEREILSVITGYLGTGYSFGIERLWETFIQKKLPNRTTTILVVSDSDLFRMLNGARGRGWEIARNAAREAGGGATAALQLEKTGWASEIGELESIGWKVHPVGDMAEVVAFARAFAQAQYGDVREVA